MSTISANPNVDDDAACAEARRPCVLNVSQNYYVRGGSDRYFFVLGELLAKHGHRVIPFTARQKQDLESPWTTYFPPGIDFARPGALDLARFVYSPRAAAAMRRMLAAERPDLAHLHIYYGQLTASILRPLVDAGVPVIQTLHDFKLVCPVYSLLSHGQICEACQGKHYWKAVAHRCNRGSLARSLLSATETYVSRWLGVIEHVDRFISVSRFQRDKLVELGVPAEKITVVLNFKDTDGIEPATNVGEYLLYFGRIEQLKGIYTLLEAAAQTPEVPLVLVGDGDAQPRVAEIIRDRKLTHVELRGFAHGEELFNLIRGSVATILPSEGYDNCPMSVLESLAFAKPVIGSRIGGIPELVDDGVDGFLVAPRDAEALADRLRWCWQHRREAVELGQAGRRKIEAQFNQELHYERVTDVYRQVLASRAAGRRS
ncbi:MAG: glycosyltransferase family 4 protein [Pirellulales bacterium]|nr:glycosyltransferase family 4 protein [Pirellulales bacterium]